MSNQQYVSELREFASFTPREQRYIRCALEMYHLKNPEELLFAHWGRHSNTEKALLKAQCKVYQDHLPSIQLLIPEGNDQEFNGFWELLTLVTVFDLKRNMLQSFPAYRFLYERLLTARIRRWLPAAFVAAAAMPSIEPHRRKSLLTTISEQAATAPGWSTQEPIFFPEYINKEDLKM